MVLASARKGYQTELCTMQEDPNTIKRFLNAEKECCSQNVHEKVYIRTDRQSWLSLQSNNPNKSIKQLREAEKAFYMRLYRNDKEWLANNSPIPIKRTSSTRIDWNKRNEEILEEVIKIVEYLLKSEIKPVRITVGKIGYITGERGLLEKKLDKLSKTKSYLQEKVETIEQFQKRRILFTIKQYR